MVEYVETMVASPAPRVHGIFGGKLAVLTAGSFGEVTTLLGVNHATKVGVSLAVRVGAGSTAARHWLHWWPSAPGQPARME